jgi:hypothetical protein
LDTALFLDGKSLQIARPGGINQALVYNGHHRVHCLQFVGVSAPDGMIVDFYGPVAGARHDQFVINESQFNQRFAASQHGNQRQFKAYCDKAYINQSHIHAARRNFAGAPLTEFELNENGVMASLRIAVEWAFNVISQHMVIPLL